MGSEFFYPIFSATISKQKESTWLFFVVFNYNDLESKGEQKEFAGLCNISHPQLRKIMDAIAECGIWAQERKECNNDKELLFFLICYFARRLKNLTPRNVLLGLLFAEYKKWMFSRIGKDWSNQMLNIILVTKKIS